MQKMLGIGAFATISLTLPQLTLPQLASAQSFVARRTLVNETSAGEE
jgi:hypothetical protein